MKKVIKIKFVDFWEGFKEKESLIYQVLSKKYTVQLSDVPDYIFCSVLGSDYLNYDCIRIFYTGENQCPDFNVYDYSMGFDVLNYGDRYLRFPYFVWSFWSWGPWGIEKTNQRKCDLDEFSRKKHFCNFIYSNKLADSYRDELLNCISEYKKVDSAGKYRNNIGGPIKDKKEFQRSYKFTIACENASFAGYNTEKLLHAFTANTIPIYWGDPLIAQEFNNKAFINCHSYSTIEDVVERIRDLDQDDEKFLEVLKQPIFLDENRLKVYYEDFQSFLYNIFDQPLNNAYRRNIGFWGKYYEEKLKIDKGIYSKWYRIKKMCRSTVRSSVEYIKNKH